MSSTLRFARSPFVEKVPAMVHAIVLICAASCSSDGAPRDAESRDRAWRAAAEARATALEQSQDGATGANAATIVSGTLTEDEALRLALERRRELVAARASWIAARERAESAGLLPNPSLIARVEEASLEGNTLNDAAILAGFAQPIPLSDRRDAERRSEAAAAARERARFEALLVEVGTEVRGAFATALFAAESLRLREQFAARSDELAALVGRRAAAGDAAADEVARAELERVRSAQERVAAARVREAALAELAAAVGAPDAAVEGVRGELDAALALPDLEEVVRRLAEHPALVAAEADATAAAAAVDLARARRIPDLNVELLYRRIGSTNTNAMDVGISLPLPLFDQGAARVREAEAGVDAARARTETTRLELLATLRRAEARLAGALESSRSQRSEILPRHAELVRIEEARLAAGEGSTAALLLARREQVAAELAALDAGRDAHAAWAELRALAER